MTTTKYLDRINQLYNQLDADQRKFYDMVKADPNQDWILCMPSIIAFMQTEAEAEIRADAAKKCGRSAAKKAAENIINQATRKDFTGAYIDEYGQQIVFGMYAAVRIFDPLPLPDKDPSQSVKNAIPGFISAAAENTGEMLDLPSRADLITHIKTDKAAHKGIKGYTVFYDFGDGLPRVNAAYLLDMIDLLGEGTEATTKHSAPMMGQIYFSSEAGEACLCPVSKRA